MKHFLRILVSQALMLLIFTELNAQCTNHVLDWDYRDFFARNNSTVRSYVSLAQSQTQYFAFGTNRLTMSHSYTTDASIGGDNTTHTGEAGSYGTGADVEFTGNGTVTLTFQTAVTNLQFSMYDIDRNQRVQFSAMNGAVPLNVSLTKVGGTTLTVTNNNAPNARVDANNTTVANSGTNATINVDIAGPLTSLTITVSNTGTCSSSCGAGGTESGIYWISDITACSDGSIPGNYYGVSQPFTGMPNYVVVVRNNIFYYVNTANGQAHYIFQDNTHTNMNSLAYDPVNRFIYYTYSLSGSGGTVNPNEKRIRRYDMNMDTFGVVMDITSLGIPTYQQGVESGAAAFYNGNLYFGVEGGQYTESTVWKLEMDASNMPVGYSQVYAQNSTTGIGGSNTSRMHDWADFALNNGVLYDFDGGRVSDGSNTDFFQQNLLTGAVTQYTPLTVPRQVGIDWQGNVYNIGSSGGAAVNGTIGLYNGTDNQSAVSNISDLGVDFVGGSWGDAGEAIRPFCDFGDAPVSYEGADPVWSPAIHERKDSISLGTGWSREWLKRGLTSIEDTYDDGLVYTPIMGPGFSAYVAEARVMNRSGVDARLIAWIDFDGDGQFSAAEALAPMTINPSPTLQTVYLTWGARANAFVNGDFTYMRIRIAADSTGMTVNDPTGYFPNGEVEDYMVIVDNFPLTVSLTSFNAKAISRNQVELKWETTAEQNMVAYEIERSADNINWISIGRTAARANGLTGTSAYTGYDNNPLAGQSYYRLKMISGDGKSTYSEVRAVTIQKIFQGVTLYPVPANDRIQLRVNAASRTNSTIRITDLSGRTVLVQSLTLNRGINNVDIPLGPATGSGIYILQLLADQDSYNQKIIVQRH